MGVSVGEYLDSLIEKKVRILMAFAVEYRIALKLEDGGVEAKRVREKIEAATTPEEQTKIFDLANA
jgi:hypothetical protein